MTPQHVGIENNAVAGAAFDCSAPGCSPAVRAGRGPPGGGGGEGAPADTRLGGRCEACCIRCLLVLQPGCAHHDGERVDCKHQPEHIPSQYTTRHGSESELPASNLNIKH